jgi:hypothetical protein
VIQKSLWNSGFNSIKDFSRADSKQENLSNVLNRFRIKFYKRVCGNAFSVWRSGAFKAVFETIEETLEETN